MDHHAHAKLGDEAGFGRDFEGVVVELAGGDGARVVVLATDNGADPLGERGNATRLAAASASSITDQLRQIQVAGLTGETAQQLLTQARITPIFESGEMAGMEVRDITPGSLYEKIGLSEGDVIQSFNGIKLDNEGAGASVLAQLGEAEHFELVLSDGTVKSMSSNEMVELMEGSEDAKSEVE